MTQSNSDRFGRERVVKLALQLRDAVDLAGGRPSLDKVPGTLITMDYYVIVGELLATIAETGGLPAEGRDNSPEENPCTQLPLATLSPLRGARVMATAPIDGLPLRVFYCGQYWTVARAEQVDHPVTSWTVLLRSGRDEWSWVEGTPTRYLAGWLPMKGEPKWREPTAEVVADQFLRLQEWFEFAAMNLQNSTPNGDNPAGYTGAHPCDCSAFASDAAARVAAMLDAVRGQGPWPDLTCTSTEKSPTEEKRT